MPATRCLSMSRTCARSGRSGFRGASGARVPGAPRLPGPYTAAALRGAAGEGGADVDSVRGARGGLEEQQRGDVAREQPLGAHARGARVERPRLAPVGKRVPDHPPFRAQRYEQRGRAEVLLERHRQHPLPRAPCASAAPAAHPSRAVPALGAGAERSATLGGRAGRAGRAPGDAW